MRLGLPGLPRWTAPTIALLLSISILPFVLIARAKVMRSDAPRIQVVPDMDNQPKFKAQQANPLFADGRAMRSPVPGTVARGELRDDEHYYRGIVGGEFASDFPVHLTPALLRRGRERYEIFCQPCHGFSGKGDGMVAQRADRLQEGTWTPPSSFHTDLVRSRPVGQIFNTITNGIRNMPPYGSQIPVRDRWAIVAYVRALQRSQHAALQDASPEGQASLGVRSER
jgi:mono/diheme cytochrome c family protein